MKPKLILKLIEAHYQKDEKQFLEYANRIVQCFHGKAKPFVAEMVDAEIKRGLVLLGNDTGDCIHCFEPVQNRDVDHWKTCKKHPANKQIEAMKTHDNCVHGAECRRYSLTSCHGCKQWILKK